VVFGAVPVQWDATENNLFAAVGNVRHNICRIVNRCGSILFPRFELLDECSEMRGMGVAKASYWSLRHCPIADSPTRLSRAEFNLL
jgi:hypothetical protein